MNNNNNNSNNNNNNNNNNAAQQEFLIKVEVVQKVCKNMSPWKAAGPDWM